VTVQHRSHEQNNSEERGLTAACYIEASRVSREIKFLLC
jgi:hypothetical protein